MATERIGIWEIPAHLEEIWDVEYIGILDPK